MQRRQRPLAPHEMRQHRTENVPCLERLTLFKIKKKATTIIKTFIKMKKIGQSSP